MPNDAAVIRAHHRRLLAIRAAATGTVAAAWDRFANVDEPSAARFTKTAAAVSKASVAQTAAIAAALYTTIAGPVKHRLPPVVIRNDVDPEEVYQRSIVTARTVLSKGGVWLDAMAAGRARAVSTASTDVVLANRAAADVEGSARPSVRGYRRVLTGSSCMFCATASTQTYHSADLAPLHNACDCDIAPLIGTSDPGRVLNRDLLSTLKERGPDYWSQRGFVDPDGQPLDPADLSPDLIAVHEHGEMGAVVAAAGDHFTAL